MIYPPDSFYAALDEEFPLNQGDILSGVPLGKIPDPLHLCRSKKPPSDSRLGDGNYGPAELHRNPEPFKNRPELIHAKANLGLAIVVWHNCQISKRSTQKNDRPEQHFAGVAPIRPLSVFPDNPVPGHPEAITEHERIRRGERPPLFYLPAFATLEIPESCVDLRLIWPVQQSLLTARVTTLSDDARRLMYDHLFWFFTGNERQVPILCPTCDAQLPTAVGLPFESDDASAADLDSDVTG